MKRKNGIDLANYLPEAHTYSRKRKGHFDMEDIIDDNSISELRRGRTYSDANGSMPSRSAILKEEELKNNYVNKENDVFETKDTSFILNLLLILMLGSNIAYIVYAFIFGNNQINQTEIILQSIILLCLSISIIITHLTKKKKTKKKFGIISSILMTGFLCFCLMTKLEILKLPTNSVMKDFTNIPIEKALAWTTANDISVEQVYDDSDTIKEYHIIKQDVYPNIIASSIKNVVFTVSSGPDYNKETVIPDMTGWNIDEAIELIDENFLNNVTVDFEKNEEIEKDIIIEQSRKGNMKRNEEIHLQVSYGSEENSNEITMDDLVQLTEFKAVLWLKRNNISYELSYEFSNKVKKGLVISQDKKKGSQVNKDNKVKLVISKGKKIKVPDLKKMNQKQITKWIIENRLKIEFIDRYDLKTKKGKVIDVSHKKNEEIAEGTIIKITLSKGQLKFPKFDSLETFRTWANRYEISFTEEYEQNKEIKQGNIIRFSVKEGDIVNPLENIIVTISSGDTIVVPNFIGKKREEIEKSCKNLNLQCTFYYAGNTNQERDIAISQNKKSGSEVVKDTYVNIGLSSGKRTNNPNVSTSTTKPNQGGNTEKPTPTPTPVCNTKTFYIQPTWVAINDPNATCSNIKSNNPGYSFTCDFKSSDSGRKGQVLNANQLNGSTINSCKTVTLTIKNN